MAQQQHQQLQQLQNLQSQQQLSAAQLHQQKLQHLVNRPLPPIKQESMSGGGQNDFLNGGVGAVGTTGGLDQGGKYEGYNMNNYPQQQQQHHQQQQQYDEDAEESKGFFSKLCCH